MILREELPYSKTQSDPEHKGLVENKPAMYDVYIMHRTQLYLQKEQYEALQRLGSQTRRSMSDLIRSAVDDFLARQSAASKDAILDSNFGLWNDQEYDLKTLRGGWTKREKRYGCSD